LWARPNLRPQSSFQQGNAGRDLPALSARVQNMKKVLVSV
jgi:hypothetical protein